MEVQEAPDQELLVFSGTTFQCPELQPDYTSQSHMIYFLTNYCFQRNTESQWASLYITHPSLKQRVEPHLHHVGEVRTSPNKYQREKKWILEEQIPYNHYSHMREM